MSADSFSEFWSGGINNGHSDYYSIDASTNIQQYVASCETQSVTAVWGGLGGWNHNGNQIRLLQAGFFSSTSELNVSYPFWEAIGPDGVDHKMVTFGANNDQTWRGAPGDLVDSGISYTASPNSVLAYAYDETQGIWAATSASQIANNPPSFYYDGTTAESIVERTYDTPDNHAFNLRHFPNDYVLSSIADYSSSPAGGQYYINLPHFQVRSTSDGTSGGTLVSHVSATTTNGFNVHWDSCPQNDPIAGTDTIYSLVS